MFLLQPTRCLSCSLNLWYTILCTCVWIYILDFTVNPCETANGGTKIIIWDLVNEKWWNQKRKETCPRAYLTYSSKMTNCCIFIMSVSLRAMIGWHEGQGDIDGCEPCCERINQSDLIWTVSLSMFRGWPTPPLWSSCCLHWSLGGRVENRAKMEGSVCVHVCACVCVCVCVCVRGAFEGGSFRVQWEY